MFSQSLKFSANRMDQRRTMIGIYGLKCYQIWSKHLRVAVCQCVQWAFDWRWLAPPRWVYHERQCLKREKTPNIFHCQRSVRPLTRRCMNIVYDSMNRLQASEKVSKFNRIHGQTYVPTIEMNANTNGYKFMCLFTNWCRRYILVVKQWHRTDQTKVFVSVAYHYVRLMVTIRIIQKKKKKYGQNIVSIRHATTNPSARLRR